MQERGQGSRSGSGRPIRRLLCKMRRDGVLDQGGHGGEREDGVFRMYLKGRTSGTCWIGCGE